jgi:hypothetical protein
VAVYGNVDLGELTQNHAPAVGSSTSIANGGISPSIWGFRGSEDLGGGLKANFNLEGHFAADTGAAGGNGTTGAAALFRRQSNVGLSSADFGTPPWATNTARQSWHSLQQIRVGCVKISPAFIHGPTTQASSPQA